MSAAPRSPPPPRARRRRLAWAAAAAGAALLALWATASADRCGAWPEGPPGLVAVARGRGPLRVGVARVPLSPPYPVTVGGYGPWRSTASSAAGLLAARAFVADAGGQRFGLVLFDALLAPTPVVEAVRAGRDYPIWVLATHSHSSLGGYDARPTAEVAALGRYRPESARALEDAARAALDRAEASLAPAAVEVSSAVPGLTVPRSGGDPDERLTAARFVDAQGRPLAHWLVLAGHPTLVPRRTGQLDPDWPGRVARALEADGAVAFILQGAGGNASAKLGPGEGVDDFARHVLEADRAAEAAPAAAPVPEPVDFGYAAVHLPLPHPDGSRLVPRPLRAAVENVLCAGTERTLEVAALHLGPLALLAVPAEPTGLAGRFLEQQAGAARVLGLANGYVGYVDLDAAVSGRWGESKRQYFGPDFLKLLGSAARLAGPAAGLSPAQ